MNCSQSIQSQIDQGTINLVPEVFPNTLTPISISPTSNQLLRITIVQQQTVQFSINLTSIISPSNVGVVINIYQLSGSSFLFLGSVLITELIMTFQKDFTLGNYIICISSSSLSYSGTFLGQFIGYPSYANLFPNIYTGQALAPFDLSFEHIDQSCNKTLFYAITDGKLPEGIQMTLSGNIWGILPNMDCTSDNDDLSPSQNWYYEMDNTWQPWGRQWRFKVKLWMFEDESVFTEKWFCIRIHNNWSWDRDNKPPIEYEEETIEEIISEPIIDLCCEEEEVKTFVPSQLPVSLCPCNSETSSEQDTILNFLQWYESVLLNSPGEDNPYIQNFIDNFRKTEYFNDMIKKAGLEDTLLTFEEKELKAVNTLIEYYNSQLIDGKRKEDIDYIMLQLRDKENQKLPITILSQSGTYLTLNLWTSY